MGRGGRRAPRRAGRRSTRSPSPPSRRRWWRFLLLGVGVRHRDKRTQLLRWCGTSATRITGLPGWVAFPAGVATVALVTAVIGMCWDIALHIEVGHDEGPLANPACCVILVGLFGIFSAGCLAMVMPDGRPGPASVRITTRRSAACSSAPAGAFSLAGYPSRRRRGARRRGRLPRPAAGLGAHARLVVGVGVGVGTVGLAAEWGWSHVGMPVP